MAVIHNDQVISTLNELIQTCRDGQQGFLDAAENVRDSHLKQVFMQYSQQRAQFAGQLQDEVRALGGDPERGGSITGSMHRRWMDVKSAITGRDDDSIVAETERGEDVAVESYQDALGKSLPSQILALIETQFRQVKQAHDHIRDLKHSGARH